jgi:hypothetical protein
VRFQRETSLGLVLIRSRVPGILFLPVAAGHPHRTGQPVERLSHDVPASPDIEAGAEQGRTLGAQVRRPVDDEQDVARLLLHDRFEDRYQGLGEDLGPLAQAEESEREERIQALAVSRPQEGQGGVLGHLGGRERRHFDPVVTGQKVQDLGMPALLEPLEADGFGQEGVFLDVSQRLHLDGRGRLGPAGLVPDRHGLEPFEALGVQVGPPDVRRPEGVMGIDKRPAEKLFVLLTALFQRSSHTKL